MDKYLNIIKYVELGKDTALKKLKRYLLRISKMKQRQSSKLEQLERLRSEDTPCRLMITHIIESYWIPSQKKTKSKLQI